jgi:hypothetical protein
MYESHHVPPVSRHRFMGRLASHLGVASGIVFTSLALGMVGYEHYERLAWRDAFLNSAMLLGGMGPVNVPQTSGGKLFAGLYALYAGLIFIVVAALLGTPIFHRLLHKLHWLGDRP